MRHALKCSVNDRPQALTANPLAVPPCRGGGGRQEGLEGSGWLGWTVLAALAWAEGKGARLPAIGVGGHPPQCGGLVLGRACVPCWQRRHGRESCVLAWALEEGSPEGPRDEGRACVAVLPAAAALGVATQPHFVPRAVAATC
ncbi:hypothetical protein HaLaN_29559 [Haematococcus lacustris]|uniref:Uncharacterized protein n=1 Tax=Haematococcus lacustris TaxID=44745 RepID=A0A6A0ACV1_HAELA|nr:hypothetical protein HaLaN_29559 [Haematococcus lacustris]